MMSRAVFCFLFLFFRFEKKSLCCLYPFLLFFFFFFFSSFFLFLLTFRFCFVCLYNFDNLEGNAFSVVWTLVLRDDYDRIDRLSC